MVSVQYDGDIFWNSKPCLNCCKSLLEVGITSVIWFENDFWKVDLVDNVIKTAILSSGDRFCIKHAANVN